MQQCLRHCDKDFTISNINININFNMGFSKLNLGSGEIVIHIYYIKCQLLGLFYYYSELELGPPATRWHH